MNSSKAPFKPSRQEARADVTDRAAREIIETEATLRHQKIARLRTVRLDREAAARATPPVVPTPKSRKKGK